MAFKKGSNRMGVQLCERHGGAGTLEELEA
jgi:hypothetical protein